MATLKDRIKTIAISIFLILLCVISLIFFIERNYENIGECASIIYYHPISVRDIYLMTLICMSYYCLSLALLKRASKVFMIVEGIVYLIILLIFSIGGNDILESRKIRWPIEYNPKPIEITTENKPILDILQVKP